MKRKLSLDKQTEGELWEVLGEWLELLEEYDR